MAKELRIAVLVFLVYLIYGLSSLFSLGDIVTPYFLNPIVFVIVSSSFLFMNLKIDGRFFLFIAFLIQLTGAFADVITIELIAQRLESNTLINFVNSKEFIYGSLIIYFGGLLLLLIPLQRTLKNFFKTGVLSVFVLLSVICILFDYRLLSEISLMFYYLLYFLFVQFKQEKERKDVAVISSLFLLILLLNIFKYLV